MIPQKQKCLSLSDGFTLIELLVVIAIIGLLATIAMVSMNRPRLSARENRRLADIKQLQTALEMFYDANGIYPRYDGSGTISCTDGWAWNSGGYASCWSDLETQLSPYIKKLPADPLHPDRYYRYRTMNSGQGYYLIMSPELSSTGYGQSCYPSFGYCVGMGY